MSFEKIAVDFRQVKQMTLVHGEDITEVKKGTKVCKLIWLGICWWKWDKPLMEPVKTLYSEVVISYLGGSVQSLKYSNYGGTEGEVLYGEYEKYLKKVLK